MLNLQEKDGEMARLVVVQDLGLECEKHDADG